MALESSQHTHKTENWKQLKCQEQWAKLASFGQFGFISGPHFQKKKKKKKKKTKKKNKKKTE